MSKTETKLKDFNIRYGTYEKINENLSDINENDIVLTPDKNVPIPTTADVGKVVEVNDDGEYALTDNLQEKITSDNRLSSSLVDDTNSTNKFVTQSEKEQISNLNNKLGIVEIGSGSQGTLTTEEYQKLISGKYVIKKDEAIYYFTEFDGIYYTFANILVSNSSSDDTKLNEYVIEIKQNIGIWQLKTRNILTTYNKTQIDTKISNISTEEYELPIATSTTLGGVKIGNGLKSTSDGTISIDNGDENYIGTDAYAYFGGGISKNLTNYLENHKLYLHNIKFYNCESNGVDQNSGVKILTNRATPVENGTNIGNILQYDDKYGEISPTDVHNEYIFEWYGYIPVGYNEQEDGFNYYFAWGNGNISGAPEEINNIGFFEANYELINSYVYSDEVTEISFGNGDTFNIATSDDIDALFAIKEQTPMYTVTLISSDLGNYHAGIQLFYSTDNGQTYTEYEYSENPITIECNQIKFIADYTPAPPPITQVNGGSYVYIDSSDNNISTGIGAGHNTETDNFEITAPTTITITYYSTLSGGLGN